MSLYGLHPKAAAAPRVNAEDAVQSPDSSVFQPKINFTILTH